jgi:hypothetical protein
MFEVITGSVSIAVKAIEAVVAIAIGIQLMRYRI